MSDTRRFLVFAVLVLLLLTACGRTAVPISEVTQSAPTAAVTAVPTEEVAAATATLTPEVEATAVAETAVEATRPGEWPSPVAVEPELARRAPTTAEQETAAALATAVPPERDDVGLAIAFRGLQAAPKVEAEIMAEPLAIGTRQTFNVPDIVHNTVSQIEAELLAVSDHGYFWFDLGPGAIEPDSAMLAQVADQFDEIYEVATRYFGPEANPGLDGDTRVHIVNASPVALCGVEPGVRGNCPLAGLVNSTDMLPAAVDPRSNEREMFVMNVEQFGGDFYLGVLGHEFRHMIEDNYDKTDTDWAKEGSATLAAELLGLPSAGPERGNLFLQNPDQQLNSWTDENTAPFYGQGYVLNRYIFDRLGEDFYLDYATSPLPGLLAVESLAAERGLDVTGDGLWLDWLAALAIHNDANAPEQYRFESGRLSTAATTQVDDLPATYATTVGQYAADYYTLPERPVTLTFSGSTLVPLLEALPPSGESMWYAQRANYSNPRLTRAVDLRDVAAATLRYAVYADIEQGYDFAYVSVSEDGGRTWQALAAENMQGQNAADNPAGSALTERFYSRRVGAWVDERVDLTAYAGKEILLRFEYVTDPVLTYGGFAVDNIAIPEIGFFDDAETAVDGWTAEGFTRAAAYLPQQWHLQLITYENGVPSVQQLALNDDQSLTLTVDGRAAGQRPILIVAATAPQTLAPAHYELTISD